MKNLTRQNPARITSKRINRSLSKTKKQLTLQKKTNNQKNKIIIRITLKAMEKKTIAMKTNSQSVELELTKTQYIELISNLPVNLLRSFKRVKK